MTAEPSVVVLISAARSGSKYVRDLLGASRYCTVAPFDINFVWRHGNEQQSSDLLEPESLSSSQRLWIRQRVLRICGASAMNTAQIAVEKSVSNSLRVPFVRAVFPEARLIHLVRDGRAVAESARRAWIERPSLAYSLQKLGHMHLGGMPYLMRYALNQLRAGTTARSTRSWGPRYPGMDADLANLPLLHVCALQWLECVRRAESGFASAPQEQIFRIRYEDLVTGRESVLDMCRFAGIPDPEAVVAAWQTRNDPSNTDKWRDSLDTSEISMLNELMREELDILGYGI